MNSPMTVADRPMESDEIERLVNKVLEEIFCEQLSPVIGRVLQMNLLSVGLKIVERTNDR